jgi:hypothetical protein
MFENAKIENLGKCKDSKMRKWEGIMGNWGYWSK